MEHQIIVVSEVAPRLRVFETEPAKEFLREYGSYENRLNPNEGKKQMSKCMEPGDLLTLQTLAEPLEGYLLVYELPPAGEERDRVRVDMQSPIRPVNLAAAIREEDEDDEEEEEEEERDIPMILYNSNAHIELMILRVLGPQSQEESILILKKIKMPKDSTYGSLAVAAVFMRQWAEGVRWCAAFLPREKSLVKIFLANIYPRKLAATMENQEIKKIQRCLDTFLRTYKIGVAAKRTLSTLEDLQPRAEEVKPTGKPWTPRAQPAVAQPAVAAAKSAEPRLPNSEWKATMTCFNCNKMGHIKPDCPLLKKFATPMPAKKLNVVAMGGKGKQGPYLTVDLTAIDSPVEPVLRMMAHLDSGAELDGVGKNWVPYLELHGGVISPLEVPQLVEWSDKGVTREVDATVNMHLQIVGSEIIGDLTFFVLPWDTDHAIVGWETMKKLRLLGQLEDLLAVQQAKGLTTGVGTTDGNQVIVDMDGQPVSTDEYLFVDEPRAVTAPPASDLTSAQSGELKILIDSFAEVFETKPAGAAKVEEMAIEWIEGWKPPPMASFRRFPPRVQAALEMDLQKKLEAGVVVLSDSDYGCPVQPVPKPDSESGYRFAVDMRSINSGVVVQPFPLPTIADVLSSLAGCMFFAKMDLKWGYWQFPVRPSDQRHLSFVFGGRIYEYRVVPMGFVQSAFHVQRCMYRLFVKYFGRGIMVYLDDIIVYAKSWEDFKSLLSAAFEILREANLFVKREKCIFGARELPVLGHVVSKEGLRSAEGRIDAILAVPFPKNTRELRRFLGMTNFMRDYIPGYSLLAKGGQHCAW